MSRITALETADVRFPTSLLLDGSDAMNPDPDYSAAYVRLTTDAADGLTGHGFVFTIGRGNDVQVAAIEALAGHLVGRDADELLADMGGTWRELVHDSQLRWLGPEKGVMHMAIGAVVNALWDLRCKREGRPLWQVLAAMSPEELVALVDFRYLTDALTPAEALQILRAAEPGRAEREAHLLRDGYPAYTTTPGWLGYDDEKLARLCREAVEEGFDQIKLKVGADLDDDLRRRIAGALRTALSPRHVPDGVVAVPAIPRNRTGKKLELPAKKILLGAPLDDVASRDVLAEPTSLDTFVRLAAARRQS